jgi:hypothetical protein
MNCVEFRRLSSVSANIPLAIFRGNVLIGFSKPCAGKVVHGGWDVPKQIGVREKRSKTPD